MHTKGVHFFVPPKHLLLVQYTYAEKSPCLYSLVNVYSVCWFSFAESAAGSKRSALW